MTTIHRFITDVTLFAPLFLRVKDYFKCGDVLREKIVKEFPACYESRCFITVVTGTRQWSLLSDWQILSTSPHPVCLKSVLILSFHLQPCFPCSLNPSGISVTSSAQLSGPRLQEQPLLFHVMRLTRFSTQFLGHSKRNAHLQRP